MRQRENEKLEEEEKWRTHVLISYRVKEIIKRELRLRSSGSCPKKKEGKDAGVFRGVLYFVF